MTGRADRVPVRTDLEDLEPYGAPQLDVPVRLNTNETAEPPPSEYLEAVASRLGDLGLNRYPDRSHAELRQRLAEALGTTAERVWAANGSNEILLQLLQAYGGPDRRLLLFRPGYSMYPVIARVTMTPIVEHDLPEDFVPTVETVEKAADRHAPHVVFLANPNNPTGIRAEREVIRALHDAAPQALVVVDEAYVEFGGVSVIDLIEQLPRLVVVRTFSKAFRLAGLRLGYLAGQPWVVDDVRRVRLPYHLDTIKQLAAITALEMQDVFLEHRARVAAERTRITGSLRTMPDVEPFPSDANFVLFRLPQAKRAFEAMLERGVLVRDFSDRPRLEGCLRVTIGTVAENDEFLAALRKVAG
ncbi:MAG: histidinol-phosphate transaminase [Actinobacteria bacterium]|nr:histidinol-phosphate transaminase [Actinomycetota bacterium]